MRSFEQRVAEIHRRSEEILKARQRRRKGILLTCVPLALCVVLISALVLPGNPPAGEPDVTGELMESVSESLSTAVVKIQISGPGITAAYTEAQDILRITDGINACKTTQPENSAVDATLSAVSREDAEISVGIAQVQTNSASAEYTVTFVTREGEVGEYRLAGNSLKDLTAGRTYTLSQKQADELRALLGISGSDTQ